jgi:hypothetical protein
MSILLLAAPLVAPHNTITIGENRKEHKGVASRRGEQKRPQSVNKHLNGTAANSADFV